MIWKLFVEEQSITNEVRPNKDNSLAFMKECRDGPRKYAATTLWTVFSCLNKFCLHLYEINLNVSINDSLIFIFFSQFTKIDNDCFKYKYLQNFYLLSELCGCH